MRRRRQEHPISQILDALLPRPAAGVQPTAKAIASTLRTCRWPSIPDPKLIVEIGSRVANARTAYVEDPSRTHVAAGKPQPQRTDLEPQVTGAPVPYIEVFFPSDVALCLNPAEPRPNPAFSFRTPLRPSTWGACWILADRPTPIARSRCASKPPAVDDTVMRFVDKHREFIQAKERIRRQRRLEEAVEAFREAALLSGFRCAGSPGSVARGRQLPNQDLRDICQQAAGAEGYEEWHGGLPKGKRYQVEEVRKLLERQDDGTLFALLKQVDIEIAIPGGDRARLCTTSMPECESPMGLFRILRDICGGNARYRKGDHPRLPAR